MSGAVDAGARAEETLRQMAPEDIAKQLSRRSLLKTGLIGIAVVTVGSVGLALQPTRAGKAAKSKLLVLNAQEYAVLTAIADRLCPPLGEGAPGAKALDVAGKVDALLAGAEADGKQGLKMLLRVFESGLTGAVFFERVRPFTQLSGEDQDRVLSKWRDSKIGFRRTVFRALSSLVGALYYGDERTWKRIGYPGPPSLSGLRATYAENLVDLDAMRATKP